MTQASLTAIGVTDGRKGRLKSGLTNIAAPGALLLLLFAGWEAAVILFRTPAFILPRPSAILVEIFTDWSLYQDNLIFTLKNVLLGFALAFVVAMVLGFVVAHSKIANRTLYPILVASQTVPVIAIAPIFIIWFGYGILPKVITTALICFFPLTVNTIAGYMSVDPDQKTLFKAYNAGVWNTFAKLTFPAALPYIMSGLKITVTLSVIGGVIGEWIGSEQGLGYLIIQSSAQIITVRVFAAVTLLAWMGIVLFVIASLVERLVTPWKRND
jgi:ABC-type nitrate/sulfonate/bicarbonate transport system permease component